MRYKYNYRFVAIEADKPSEDKTTGLVRRTAFSSAQAVACRDKTPQAIYRRPIGGPGPWLPVRVLYPNGGSYKFTDTDRTALEAIRVLESLRDDAGGYSPEVSTGRREGISLAIKALRGHFRLA